MMFTVIWGLTRVFLGGFLAMLGIGLVGGVLVIAATYLFGNVLVAGLASGLLAVGATVIRWTGTIFNFFVEHLITKYSETLGTLGLSGGIDVVWSAFRDVANIALIGLFVFLAINIILGVKEYGEKKMIAKILVIAVLLNFSLLFTKVIIDTANFTAYQFYKSAGLERTRSAGVEGDLSSGGVADVFLNAAGITTAGDTFWGVKALADKNMGAALAFTVVATLLLFVMVGLFLYGAFQMLTRAILLVVLMILAPLAFVSWLVPSSTVEAGWKTWWESLISAAFFSPLFMMSLWASMLLLQKAGETRGGTTLGQFFTDPTKSAEAWTLIVVYCFAVGLLYFSIKFASSFANSIVGFSTISTGLRNALVGVPALAWRFGVAPLARQTIGRSAYFGRAASIQLGRDLTEKAGHKKQEARDLFKMGKIDEAKKNRMFAEAKTLENRAGKHALWAGRFDPFAKAGFNLGDAGLARQLTKVAGVSELLAGQRPKEVDVGFKQGIEKKIKLGQERMEALEVKPGERQKLREEAAEKVEGKAEYQAEAQRLQREHEAAQREHDSEKARVERDEGGHITSGRIQLRATKAEVEEIKRSIYEDARRRIETTTDAGEVRRIVAERNRGLKQEDLKVARAQKRLDALTAPLKEAKKNLDKTAGSLKRFAEAVDREANYEGNRRVRARQLGNVGAAEYLGRKSAGTGQRAAAWLSRDYEVVDEIASGVAKNVRGKVGTGNLKATIARLRRDFSEEFDEGAGE